MQTPRLEDIINHLLNTKTKNEFLDVLDKEFLGSWDYIFTDTIGESPLRLGERIKLAKDIRGLAWGLVNAIK